MPEKRDPRGAPSAKQPYILRIALLVTRDLTDEELTHLRYMTVNQLSTVESLISKAVANNLSEMLKNSEGTGE